MIDLALRLSSGYPERVRRALLSAMAVEANFRNVDYGDRDSEGVLQQRPSTGWGPATESAATDIQQFLGRAEQANQGFRGTPGQLAQAVQRSAFPDRYDQRMGEVRSILGGAPQQSGRPSPREQVVGRLGTDAFNSAVAAQLLQSARARVNGQEPNRMSLLALATMRESLAAAQQRFGPEPVGRAGGKPSPGGGGLVAPLGTPLGGGSEFSISDPEGAPDSHGHRFHAGKDWFAPAGAAVRAPWAGRVVEVRASRGNSGQVFGGTVKIQAPNGRVFVARHVDPRGVEVGASVRPGQVVAGVTSWRDGSPHAHIEVWKTLAGGYRLDNMIDPVSLFGRGSRP